MEREERATVRVIGFRSASEYNAFRLRPTADAYYIGTESRDYIVMPALGANEFPVAAHEYAHLVLRASGLRLPPWLNEGLAEYFSTVRIGRRGWEIAGTKPAHLQILRQRHWMPLAQLLTLPVDSPIRLRREDDALFYAQSWALTQMMLASPQYRPGFAELLAAISSEQPSAQAILFVYGRSLEAVGTDLRTWVREANARPVELSGMVTASVTSNESVVSPLRSRLLIADLLEASGELNRAEVLYRDLARELPANADICAALGTIALRKGDREAALSEFRQALDKGITDPRLCYRYAILAEGALPTSEIRRALARALALKPDFDDSRYVLALLESNAGNYEAAVAQLQAMNNVAPARAYVYWSTLANALGELGRRDESKTAADLALQHASTAEERAHAARLAYFAQTDLTVQFARDANGRQQLVTTRVPHGSAWNPFIEPGDHIRRVQGQLRSVDCDGNKITAVTVQTKDSALKLSIPDPLHVLMRNAPSEFMCGPQAANAIVAEYAISEKAPTPAGILRGMEFQ
jgi:tetratricopeptide (TPR) repeat protein